MSSKVFKDYQGESIKIGGVCYKFAQETTKVINSDPSEIEGTFASCLECALESSSSSEQFSESSSSSENFSESSSSSENFSESSSSENFSESSSSSENFSESSSSSNCCLDLVYILQPCDDLFEGSDISSSSSAVNNVYIMCRSVANSLLDKFSSSSSDCPDVLFPHQGDTFWYFEFVTPGWDPNGFQIHRSPTDISGITSIDDVRATYPYATIHLIDTIERGASCNALVDERIEIAGDVNGYRAWKFCSCYELWEWVKGSSSSSSSSSSFEPESESSSSSEGGGGFAPGNEPQINITLTGGGGYPRTFLGQSFDEGVTQAIEATLYENSVTNTERWRWYSFSQVMELRAAGADPYIRFISIFIAGYPNYIKALNPSGFPLGVGFNPTWNSLETGGTIGNAFFAGGTGGVATPQFGPFNGVTIKWERGNDGTGAGNTWKANQ